jgi:predicted DNA-binding transcriptional regulator YafY
MLSTRDVPWLIALNKAMHSPEEFVLRMHYTDKKGKLTQRVISPISIVNDQAFMALCLCREEPRRFQFDCCSNVELLNANDVLMPVEIVEVTSA